MELARILSKLSPEDKALFLARIIHDVTVYARISPPDKLKAANQFVHRVVGYLKDALSSQEWAGDDLIAETIDEYFKAIGVKPDVAGWLKGLER